MLKKHMTQSHLDARNLVKVARRALKALKRTHAHILRRGRGAVEELEGWDGPDAADNEKLHGRVARAAEALDECLDDVATRRALAHAREPAKKETREQRRARRCERVAGLAFKTLGRLQGALDEGEWTRALKIAREGARELERRLDRLRRARLAERRDTPPPIAEAA